MKLYLIDDPNGGDWETYDSFVVVAKDEEQANLVGQRKQESSCAYEITYLGEYKGKEKYPDGGIILGSFNAG